MGMGYRQSGFTLTELIVALAVAAVMKVYAIPAFNDFTVQRRIASDANSVISAVNYARSEAARLGGQVTVQAVNGGAGGNEWGPGFCVTVGDPGNCNAPLLNLQVSGASTINALGASLNGEDAWSFNSRGMIEGGLQGTVRVCGADITEDPGRVITINAVGRASIEEIACF